MQGLWRKVGPRSPPSPYFASRRPRTPRCRSRTSPRPARSRTSRSATSSAARSVTPETRASSPLPVVDHTGRLRHVPAGRRHAVRAELGRPRPRLPGQHRGHGLHARQPVRRDRHRLEREPVQGRDGGGRGRNRRSRHPDRHLHRRPGVLPDRHHDLQRRRSPAHRHRLPRRRLLPAGVRCRLRLRRPGSRRRRLRAEREQLAAGPHRAVVPDHGRCELHGGPLQRRLVADRREGAVPQHLPVHDEHRQRRRHQLGRLGPPRRSRRPTPTTRPSHRAEWPVHRRR